MEKFTMQLKIKINKLLNQNSFKLKIIQMIIKYDNYF